MNIVKLLSTTVSQNAIASAIRTGLQIIIGFTGSFIVIRAVSPEAFGAWALTLTIASFMGLIDFGVATAMIKYTAADPKNTPKIFWTAIYYYAVAGFLASTGLVLFQWFQRGILFKGYDPTFAFIAVTALGTYIGWIASNFNNTLNGLQLMKRSSTIEVIKSFFFYVFIIPSIPFMGIFAFPFGYFMSNLVGLVISYSFIKGKADLTHTLPDRHTFSTLLSYGLKSYGMHITALVKSSYIKLIASQLFNLQYVAYVEMSQKIATYIRQLYSSVSLPLLPAASSYQSKGDHQKIRKLFIYSQSIFTALGVAVTSTFVLFAPFLVTLWLGPAYAPVIPIARLEILGIFGNMLLAPVFTIYQGLGRFRPILVTFFVNVLLLLTVAPLIANTYGFHGLYYGYLLAEFAATVGFYIWFIRKRLPL